MIVRAAATLRVLAAMLAQPVWYEDAAETPEQRADLLRPVAMAIALATEDRTEQAAMVALGWHESRWARYVVEGRCQDGPRGARCDNGRARSPWQVWAVACPSAHAVPADHPVVNERAASCAVRLLRGGRNRCRGLNPAGDWAGAFSSYGRGASCQWAPAAERVATMQTVWARLGSD